MSSVEIQVDSPSSSGIDTHSLVQTDEKWEITPSGTKKKKTLADYDYGGPPNPSGVEFLKADEFTFPSKNENFYLNLVVIGKEDVGKLSMFVDFLYPDVFGDSKFVGIGHWIVIKEGEKKVPAFLWTFDASENLKDFRLKVYQETDVLCLCFDIGNVESLDYIENVITSEIGKVNKDKMTIYLVGLKSHEELSAPSETAPTLSGYLKIIPSNFTYTTESSTSSKMIAVTEDKIKEISQRLETEYKEVSLQSTDTTKQFLEQALQKVRTLGGRTKLTKTKEWLKMYQSKSAQHVEPKFTPLTKQN